MTSRAAAALALATMACAACTRASPSASADAAVSASASPSSDGGGGGGATAATDAAVAIAGDASPANAALGPSRSEHPTGCRAIQVSGDVSRAELDAGTPVRALELLPAGAEVTLGAGATLSLKSAATGREATIAGPARARTCVAGNDEVWLLRGALHVGGGAAASPGAELTVVTAFGVVRAAAADFAVRLDDKGAHVTIARGAALVWAPDAAAFAPFAAGAGVARDLTRRTTIAEARVACERAAAAAESVARDIAGHGGDAATALGELAAKEVEARGVARAACKVARLRVESELPSGQRAAAEQAIDRADERWTRLP